MRGIAIRQCCELNQFFFTNSDFSFIWPKPSILQSMLWSPSTRRMFFTLVPIRQLALFKEMQGVKDNKGLNEEEKTSKTSALKAQLDDLDRLTAALGAMTSVTKAVQ